MNKISTLFSRLTDFLHYFQRSQTLSATIWYIIGLGLEKIIAFGSLIVLANVLTAEEIGIYSVYGGWRGILTIVLTLNLSFSVTIAFFEFEKQVFQQFISAITTLGWLVIGLVAIVVSMIPRQTIEYIFGIDPTFVFLIILWSFIIHPYSISQFIWKSTYAYKTYVFFQIGSVILQFSLGFLAIYLLRAREPSSDLVFAFVMGMTLSIAIPGILLGIYRIRQGLVSINRKLWMYGLSLSVPFIFHVLSHSVLTRADQIMIANIIGDYEAGIYSVAYRFGEISILIWSAMSSVWLVWFKEKLEKSEYARIRRGASVYALGFSLIVIALIFAGMPGIYFLFPIEYHAGIALIPLIAASGFFAVLYSFFITVEYYEKRNIQTAIVTAFAAVINIILNWIFLPVFGMNAAAWTTITSYILIFLLHTAYVTLIMKKNYFNLKIFFVLACLMLIFVIGLHFIMGRYFPL